MLLLGRAGSGVRLVPGLRGIPGAPPRLLRPPRLAWLALLSWPAAATPTDRCCSLLPAARHRARPEPREGGLCRLPPRARPPEGLAWRPANPARRLPRKSGAPARRALERWPAAAAAAPPELQPLAPPPRDLSSRSRARGPGGRREGPSQHACCPGGEQLLPVWGASLETPARLCQSQAGPQASHTPPGTFGGQLSAPVDRASGLSGGWEREATMQDPH